MDLEDALAAYVYLYHLSSTNEREQRVLALAWNTIKRHGEKLVEEYGGPSDTNGERQ